jgi:signal transduction histidine kinase/CheY-like chemotaxis protein
MSRIHPEDLPEYLRLNQEATLAMRSMTWEGRAFSERPGEMKWIRARSNPTLQPDGSVLWDGLMEDVTELKLGEEALRRSEAQAQEASRAKSAFLASMSHELRTPLSAILGYSRLMARDPLRNEEDRIQLEHILKAGEHLLSLINDVLSLSKIEAGRMDVKRVAFDPAALVRELESLFRLTALGKGLSFEVEAQGLPDQLEGDPAKLRQVLVNLLGNALKFTSRGTVRLRVAWFDDTFTAAVEDTGPGIPVEDQAALFGAFNQASLGSSVGGTGLGLHISQALVTLMGGSIGVSSTAGQGARFHFTLPLSEPEVPALLSAHGRVLHLAAGEAPRELLVVDDRPENRDILDRLLRMVGFHCSLAEHGLAALEQWRERRPDLILMDLRMPVMDGFEAVSHLRTQEREAGLPRTPVIAISASVYDVSAADLFRRGFDAFLTKPIEEEQLFSVLEAQLGLRFERADPVPSPEKPQGLEALRKQDPGWRERFLAEVLTGDLEAAEALLVELLDSALAEATRQRLRAYHLEDILQHLR